jgi:hypothetical protein
MEIYIPDYVQNNFDSVLEALGKDCILNYSSATPTSLLAEITNLNFKNKTNNNDNNMQIRTSLSNPIEKGDYLKNTDDNKIYLITWTVTKEIDCYQTIGQICTNRISFKRWQSEEIDSTTGELIHPAQYMSVADNVDCSIEKKGNFVFNTTISSPGIVPQAQMMILMQANSDTLSIQIGDEYLFRNNIGYVIQDVDYSQVSMNDDGILIVFADKREGGWRVTI